MNTYTKHIISVVGCASYGLPPQAIGRVKRTPIVLNWMVGVFVVSEKGEELNLFSHATRKGQLKDKGKSRRGS
uniref:Uncharacterized protein n=1 Tax=viral metagenome TaxID=1070528 RepID=A0A6M3KD12_9ZZZZ